MKLLTVHKYALWSENSETTHYHNNYIIIVVKFIELRTMVPISEYLLLAYHSSLTTILYILEQHYVRCFQAVQTHWKMWKHPLSACLNLHNLCYLKLMNTNLKVPFQIQSHNVNVTPTTLVKYLMFLLHCTCTAVICNRRKWGFSPGQ